MLSEYFSVSIESYVLSQWQSKRKSATFLLFRWLMFLTFLAILMILFVLWDLKGHLKFFLIYLSIWNIILCTLSSFLGAILVTLHYYDKLEEKVGKFYATLLSIMSNTSSVMSLLIAPTTIVFHGERQFCNRY
jgi:drug/metabolite transporter (DMT)-like permease